MPCTRTSWAKDTLLAELTLKNDESDMTTVKRTSPATVILAA
jgi:hypothetical protein